MPFEIEENLSEAKNNKRAKGEYKTVYSVQNGSVSVSSENDVLINGFKQIEKLKLLNSTVVSNFLPILNVFSEIVNSIDQKERPLISSFFVSVISTCLFATHMTVYLDMKDKFQYVNPYQDIKKKFKIGQIDDKEINNLISSSERYYHISLEDIVPIKQIQAYKNRIRKIRDFIKIIKPSLNDIVVDSIELDKEHYKCRKIFVYDGYNVSYEFESTGIKKMVELYNYIKNAFDGGIVFIDEIDANISGVFLDKLMECFNEKGKGQLCFTTHNYYSMNVLRRIMTITTIGENGMIVDVTKRGNSSPANSFYSGQIMDSPFDIEPYDFEKMFVD